MGYVEQNLTPGESVLYRTRLHWVTLVGPATLGAVFGIPGLLLLFGAVGSLSKKSGSAGTMSLFGLVLLVVAAIIVGSGILTRNATEMAVTNKRVIIKAGILSKRTVELFLSRVESVGVEQDLVGRILGYGSIVVRGTGGTAEPFARVSAPLEFRRQVQTQIENLQMAKPAQVGV